MTMHEYVMTNGIQIDTKLAPLIEAVWNEGLTTEFCCEEIKQGTAHIVFGNTEDALRFTEHTRYVLNDLEPALIFHTELAMCPMPGEAGRWSVEFHKDCIEIITDVWTGTEIDMCDCYDCMEEFGSWECDDCEE